MIEVKVEYAKGEIATILVQKRNIFAVEYVDGEVLLFTQSQEGKTRRRYWKVAEPYEVVKAKLLDVPNSVRRSENKAFGVQNNG